MDKEVEIELKRIEKKMMNGKSIYSFDGQGFHFAFCKHRGKWWMMLGSLFNLTAEDVEGWIGEDNMKICFAPLDDSLNNKLVEFLKAIERKRRRSE